MNPEKKPALTALLLIFLFFLGFSLFINLPAMYNNFLFADQAVYFSMGMSIAKDGDLEFSNKDLVRYYQNFVAGPQGIFLKRGTDGKIFYAKSFAYPLMAAPFVKVFGANGFFVFHALLLGLVLFLGVTYFSLAQKPAASLGGALSFLFASVAGVYFFWISPDFFNLCLVFIILFLWAYKLKHRDEPPPGEPPGRFRNFLLSSWSDYLAAFLAGIAVFSKPPNAALLVPLVLTPLLEKKIKKPVLIIAFFALSAAMLFGTNYLMTSDWNFMGGERKTFYNTFPYEKAGVTFDNTGHVMTSEGYFDRFLLPPKFIALNLFYYFFGRFTGIAWYFFPACMFLLLFFFGRRRRYQWLLLAAGAGEILIYIILMPTNYGGGGGSLANRYFMNIYPLFFFLPGIKITKRHLTIIWFMAAVFVSQILVAPFQSSASPASHAKKFPIKRLPVEMTLVNEFPTNTNPYGFRVPIGTAPNEGMLHFLDDNFNRKAEPTGIWTWGDRTAEIILKTYFPVEKIVVNLTNNPRKGNVIKVNVDGKSRKIKLRSKEKGKLEFPVRRGFRMKSTYLHKLKIKASKGSIPYYEGESSDERRNLGVFFELELVPEK